MVCKLCGCICVWVLVYVSNICKADTNIPHSIYTHLHTHDRNSTIHTDLNAPITHTHAGLLTHTGSHTHTGLYTERGISRNTVGNAHTGLHTHPHTYTSQDTLTRMHTHNAYELVLPPGFTARRSNTDTDAETSDRTTDADTQDRLGKNVCEVSSEFCPLASILISNTFPLRPSTYGATMSAPISAVIPTQSSHSPYPLYHTRMGPFTSYLPESYGKVLTDSLMRKRLLDMHNYVRKLETVDATYMIKLVWDFQLEAYALQWAQYLCTASSYRYFSHSPDSDSGSPAWPWRSSTGENLYTTSGLRDESWDPSDVILKWYKEREYFDWRTGRPTSGNSGKPIGHYTQLVRQQTSAVGCVAITDCKERGDWRTFVVCHYDYGNFGRFPYERRTSGSRERTCERCPSGFGCCESGLCDGAFSSLSLANFIRPTEFTGEWYGCKLHERESDKCARTGARVYTTTYPNDRYNLEINPCQCLSDLDIYDPFEYVRYGQGYYRSKCIQMTGPTNMRSHIRGHIQTQHTNRVDIFAHTHTYKSTDTHTNNQTLFFENIYLDFEEVHRQPLTLPTGLKAHVKAPPSVSERMRKILE